MAKKNEVVENEQVEAVENEQVEDTVKVESPIEPTEPKEKPSKPEVKSDAELADEVEAGKYGTGRERMILLGDRYDAVQYEVMQRYKKRTKL